MSTVLVTGATGTIGSILARRLRANGVRVRALVRDSERGRAALGNDVELAVGAFDDPASLPPAMEGVDALFLACGNVARQVDYECAVIDAAATSGVVKIVKLSARGAALDASVAFWQWHAEIEAHLRASGIPSVVLQPSFSMANLLAAADQVRARGMLFAPAAAARIAMIDPADVAAVAAVAVTGDDHSQSCLVLTGPAAISYAQVAADLSAATGRSVGYVDIPPEAAVSALVESGLPPFAAAQIVNAYTALRHGAQATTTDTVEVLTGRSARPFGGYARDHADVFRSETFAGGTEPTKLSA